MECVHMQLSGAQRPSPMFIHCSSRHGESTCTPALPASETLLVGEAERVETDDDVAA